MKKRELLEKAVRISLGGLVIQGVTVELIESVTIIDVFDEDGHEIDETSFEVGKNGSFQAEIRGTRMIDNKDPLMITENYRIEHAFFQIEKYTNDVFSVSLSLPLILEKR